MREEWKYSSVRFKKESEGSGHFGGGKEEKKESGASRHLGKERRIEHCFWELRLGRKNEAIWYLL